jgi:hypothetical protein
MCIVPMMDLASASISSIGKTNEPDLCPVDSRPVAKEPTMAVGDVYQVQIFYNIGSELTMNVVHVKEVVTSTDDIPARSVGAMIHNMWTTHIATTLFSNETSVVLIQVRRIKPTPGVPATLIVGSAAFPGIAGTGPGDPLPSTTAALISMYTDTHTRNARGRMYLPGLASGTQNDGQLLAATLGQLEAFAEDFEDDIVAVAGTTGTWHFVVYSRTLGTSQEITQAVAHSNLATQRGRRNHPGLGV